MRLALGIVMGLAVGACTDTRLEYPEEEIRQPLVDDELMLDGAFCTSPAADVAYPVKVMFIVDGSGSQQFTDQNRQRVVAVEETINALIGQPNIYFKVVVFNASVTATPSNFGDPPPPAFSNDINELVPALANLAEADTLTDYQGALAVAYSELLRDMSDVFGDQDRGPAELARTKYVMILISDGLPDPQCQVGLGNDQDPNFPNQVDLLCEDPDYLNCILEVSDPVLGETECADGICDFNGTLCYQVENAQTLFGGLATLELAAGGDYNQPYQILDKVQSLMDLEERFDIGEIRLHAGLVLDPEADPAIIDIFGDASQARPLMQQVAETGQGNYMEFYGGDEIDFLSINYDSLKQPRIVRAFFADNRAARISERGLSSDTDMDGLTDDEEFDLGTDARRADTDGDGYSDYFEYKRQGFGFDAHDACKPPLIDVIGVPPGTVCDPISPINCNFEYGPDANGNIVQRYFDADRDGLHDCEERALGTSVSVADTDHDSIPDGIEFVYGLDPMRWDFERDDDQDGVPNGREIEWHLHPLIQQNDAGQREHYRYDRPQVVSTLDGRPCYEFSVKRTRLAPTLHSDDLGLLGTGHNELRLYIVENMADDLAGEPVMRTACVRAQYVPPSFKQPAGGRVLLTEEDFHYLPGRDAIFSNPDVANNLFDETQHCIVAQDPE